MDTSIISALGMAPYHCIHCQFPFSSIPFSPFDCVLVQTKCIKGVEMDLTFFRTFDGAFILQCLYKIYRKITTKSSSHVFDPSSLADFARSSSKIIMARKILYEIWRYMWIGTKPAQQIPIELNKLLSFMQFKNSHEWCGNSFKSGLINWSTIPCHRRIIDDGLAFSKRIHYCLENDFYDNE